MTDSHRGTGRMALFEGRSPTLFLIGGLLLGVYTFMNGMKTFLDMGAPFVNDVLIGPAGFFLGFIALLGLYPSVADGSPILAKAAAGLAGLGAVGWLLAAVRRLVQHSAGSVPGWLEAVGLLIPVGFGLGFLAFSVASFRSDGHARIVGLVLLLPLFGVFLNFAVKAAGISIPVGRVLINFWFAVAFLTIGATLRTSLTAIGGTEPSVA